jgi:hypothetical protein
LELIRSLPDNNPAVTITVTDARPHLT